MLPFWSRTVVASFFVKPQQPHANLWRIGGRTTKVFSFASAFFRSMAEAGSDIRRTRVKEGGQRNTSTPRLREQSGWAQMRCSPLIFC